MKTLMVVMAVLVISACAIAQDVNTVQTKPGPVITLSEKPIIEGWGKTVVPVYVVDFTKEDKDFPLKLIRGRVEMKLKSANFNVTNTCVDSLFLAHIIPTFKEDGSVDRYVITTKALRVITYKDGNRILKTLFSSGVPVNRPILATPDKLMQSIDISMDNFLKAYLKANPKKKE